MPIFEFLLAFGQKLIASLTPVLANSRYKLYIGRYLLEDV